MQRHRSLARAQAQTGTGRFRQPFSARAWLERAIASEVERGRHQLWPGFFMLLGAALYFAVPVNPSPVLLYSTTFIAGVFAFSLRRHFAAFAGMACVLSFCLGGIAGDVQARRIMAPLIQQATDAVKISGTVIETQTRDASRPRVLVDIAEAGDLPQSSTPGQIRLSGKNLAGLGVGDSFETQARLRPMPPPTHPGAYDVAFFAFFDQLGGTGTVSKPVTKIESPQKTYYENVLLWIAEARADATKRIVQGLGGDTGAIAASMVTGDREGLNDDVYSIFNGSGLIHVLSISGLHMVLVAGGMFFAARFLLTLLSLAIQNLPVKKLAAVCALLLVTAYEIISGGAVATTRSYIMILIVFAAILFDRPALSMRNVVIAAILIALVTPSEIMSASFQMSFAATAALIAAHERRLFQKLRAWDGSWLARILSFLVTIFLVTLCTSIVAEIATMPFTLHHFHRVSLFGIAGNLLALIFIELAIMPGVLLTLLALPFGLEQLTLPLLGFGVDGMIGVARFVSSLPSALIGVSGFGAMSMLLCALAIAWACLWRGPVAIFAAVLYMAGMIAGAWEKPADLYISQSGWSVAVRGPDEKLTLLASPREKFVAHRWLEAQGDRRDFDDASVRANQNCDALGCTVNNPEAGLVAISYEQSSLPEDCARADILITPYFEAPQTCARPKMVIGKSMIRNAVGLSVTFDRNWRGQTAFKTRSISAECGARPWCVQPEKYKDQ